VIAGYGATAFHRQPSLGSVTSNVFGDLDVSATTLKFVPPIPRVVVKTLGVVCVMLLLTPPAVWRVAVAPAGVKV
jgi:hypothetical protein